jgi:hypothetical protein
MGEGAERLKLGGAALRAFCGIAKAWQLSEAEQIKLLGLTSRSTLYRWKSGRVSMVRRDTVE